MKRYIEPKIKIEMFRAESVVTTSQTSQYTNEINNWWEDNKNHQNAHRKMVDFQNMTIFVY